MTPFNLSRWKLERDPDLEVTYPQGRWVPVGEVERGATATTGEPDSAWFEVVGCHEIAPHVYLLSVQVMESEVVWHAAFSSDDKLFVTEL